MKGIENQMHNAQAQLMQRASILMLMGDNGLVETHTFPSIGIFSFEFDSLVKMRFDKDHPYDQNEVDAAIAKMDERIEEMYRAAQHTIEVVKAWRGE